MVGGVETASDVLDASIPLASQYVGSIYEAAVVPMAAEDSLSATVARSAEVSLAAEDSLSAVGAALSLVETSPTAATVAPSTAEVSPSAQDSLSFVETSPMAATVALLAEVSLAATTAVESAPAATVATVEDSHSAVGSALSLVETSPSATVAPTTTYPLSLVETAPSPNTTAADSPAARETIPAAEDSLDAKLAKKDEGWWQEKEVRNDGSHPNKRPDPPRECCICGAPPKMMDHTCIACTATTCGACVINLRHLACPYCHDVEANAKALRNEAMALKAINKATEWFSVAKSAFRDVADNVLERTKTEPAESASWRKSYESDYGVDYAGFGIGSSNIK